MCIGDSSNRSRCFAPPGASAEMRRVRSAGSAVAVAAILLISGCAQLPENAVGPAHPHPKAASSSGAASSAKAPLSARPADPEVRAAQESLTALGYYRDSIDGIDGPQTRAAVAKYQTDQGIPPDGRVSRDLVVQLAGARPTPAPVEHDRIERAAGPLYEPGDAYIYTDGQVETVLSVSDRRVQWQDLKGRRWSADPDFTVPSGRYDADEETDLHRGLSWPLRVGATVSYTVESALAHQPAANRNAVEHWRCAVESRDRTSVAAGTFDSYKIVCRLDGGPLGTTQSRTWYYAPAVGHYVRFIDNAAVPANGVTGTRSRDLVAVSPGTNAWPSEARTGLEWAVSHALEAEPDGRPVRWQSSAVAARFVIEPAGPVAAGRSGQCRRFRQTRIAADAAKRLYPGVACRADGGRWRILGRDGAPFERTASSS